MHLTATVPNDSGESVGIIVLAPKEFKSGREGFHGQTKITFAGASSAATRNVSRSSAVIA